MKPFIHRFWNPNTLERMNCAVYSQFAIHSQMRDENENFKLIITLMAFHCHFNVRVFSLWKSSDQ